MRDHDRQGQLSTSAIAAVVMALLMSLVIVSIDLSTPSNYLPDLLYGVPVALCAWTRSRRFVWGAAIGLAVVMVLSNIFGPPPLPQSAPPIVMWINRFFIIILLLQTALVANLWIGSLQRLDAEQQKLARQNEALAQRQREIACKNEELQSQAYELDRERMRFEAVFRMLPLGMIVCDSRFSDMRVNPAAAAILDMPAGENIAEQWRQRRWRFLSGGQELAAEDTPLHRAVSAGQTSTGVELEVVFEEGRRAILLMGAAAVRDRSGNIISAICAFSDLTSIRHPDRPRLAQVLSDLFAGLNPTPVRLGVEHSTLQDPTEQSRSSPVPA